MSSSTKQALIILTNVSKILDKDGNDKFTGFNTRAAAHLWSLLETRHFYKIDYCTPNGGPAPIDPMSTEESKDDPIVQSFLHNKSLVDHFQETISAKKIVETLNTNYSFVGLIGAHGALIDNYQSKEVAEIVSSVYKENGIICSIDHGLAGAIGSAFEERPLLEGKKVACATRVEDEKQAIKVPFYLDEKLMAVGAWVANKGPFEVNVNIDSSNDKTGGTLITGQNTASVPAWAELIETVL